VDALYLADEEDTLWAEWYRHLAERGVPPMHHLPRDVWRFRVPRLDVADLTTAEQLALVGLSPPTPGRASWPSCQDVGETLWRDGWRGLVAPSAARPGGVVLCLFAQDPATLPAEPVPPPSVVTAPPVPPTGMRT
jgi:RES domain-containing protein